MFCSKCGAENAEGAKFCKGCGNALVSTDNQQVVGNNEGVATPNNNQQVNPGATQKKSSSMNMNKIIGIAAVAVVLIVVALIFSGLSNKINLNKYLTIETEGYDGYGTARATIDWDAIEKKYGKKIKYKAAAKKEYGGWLELMTPFDAFQESVSVRLDKTNNLSNGDSIEYTWQIDEDLKKYVKCDYKYNDKKHKVSGLEKVGKFDAFAEVTMEYTGIAPNGSANLNYLGSDLNYYDFQCDKTSGLSNGDVIKVTINDSKLEDCAKRIGKVPEVTTKEYTVEGLESYVSNIAEINDDSLDAMKKQAEDTYNAKVAKDWDEGSSLASLTYIGNYLLTAKDKDSWSGHNYIYLVYKAQVKNVFSNEEKSYDETSDVYWYIRYSDLLLATDGNVKVDTNNYSTPGNRVTIDSGIDNGWWSTKSWNFEGFNSVDELYKEAVTRNVDSYNHEDNVTDK